MIGSTSAPELTERGDYVKAGPRNADSILLTLASYSARIDELLDSNTKLAAVVMTLSERVNNMEQQRAMEKAANFNGGPTSGS